MGISDAPQLSGFDEDFSSNIYNQVYHTAAQSCERDILLLLFKEQLAFLRENSNLNLFFRLQLMWDEDLVIISVLLFSWAMCEALSQETSGLHYRNQWKCG